MTDSPYVSRINQIDAAQLDDEIYKILKLQTQEITKLCPQDKVEAWQPEIDAFLKFVIWCFSLGSSKSTFGQRLLDLNYANLSRRKAIFFLILNIVPVYIRDKFANQRQIGSSLNGEKIRNYVEAAGNVLHLLSFLNLLIFLHRGRQPSLVERILGISSESTRKYHARQIGYSYMTRELLWHGLMELFSIGLPLINFHSAKQMVLRVWRKRQRDGNENSLIPQPRMDSNTRCPYCDDTPILPRHAECEHVYCYYCIKAHFAVTDSFQCLSCGTELHSSNVRVYVPKGKSVDDKLGV